MDFQPEALLLLIDRLKLSPQVGAACGRIHPIGSGRGWGGVGGGGVGWGGVGWGGVGGVGWVGWGGGGGVGGVGWGGGVGGLWGWGGGMK